MNRSTSTLLWIIAGLCAVGGAQAQTSPYPVKPIRLVVNFAAGGTTDVLARQLSIALHSSLGQPVIVDNRAGALGAIGAAEVARAAPDGYSLLLTTQGALTEIPVLYTKTPYDPETALTPVTVLGESPFVLFANPSFPANDVKGLIAYAKTIRRGIDVAVSGSSVALAIHALGGSAGIELVQVPYAGQGPALNAVLGNQVPLNINASSSALMSQVKAGKLKLLGVGSQSAVPLIPGVPPIADTLPGYRAEIWWGVFAPAHTPAPIVETLNLAISKALEDPAVIALFEANAVLPRSSTPGELRQRVSNGLHATRDLVQRFKIPVE